MPENEPIEVDELVGFLRAARNNELATQELLPNHFAHLDSIESLLRDIGENLHYPDPDLILIPAFINRAYASWLAAVRLALSGMVPEVQPLLRNSLEYALYARRLHKGREEEYDGMSLSELWLRREESVRIENLVIEHFKRYRLLDAVQDADVRARVAQLYEQTIGTGAHPNVQGVSGSLTIEGGEGQDTIIPDILVGDTVSFRFALSSTGRVGITNLEIIREIYPERFELLSLRERLENLKRSDDALAARQRSEVDSLMRNQRAGGGEEGP